MNYLPLIFALVFSPLMRGIINRTKAYFAGRQGPPLAQPYYDLWKLLQKGAVYSTTTTWIFRAGPIVSLGATLVAASLLPFANWPAAIFFSGDLILFAYLLGLARFFTVVAALDTGSAFEGMGSSREVFYSALAEPALLLSLAAVAKASVSGSILTSLTEMHSQINGPLWAENGLILVFVALALFIVFLTENSRIPVDDPTTHLELTMIHEVMVLDHSGPDFAYILYAASLKLWLLGALIVGLVVPNTGNLGADLLTNLSGMLIVAVATGVVESVMARLRLVRVPQLLVGAGALAVLALVLEYKG
jgi:formate hydrogenlyase subunit 4